MTKKKLYKLSRCAHDLQVFPKDLDKDTVVLLAAMASRVENQDAIDASIVGMLGDPKEVVDYIIFL